VEEHFAMLQSIKSVQPSLVKTLPALQEVDAIILPGGESTTISKLLHFFGLFEPLKKRIEEGMPVWGTCAGMILLAKELEGGMPHLGVMDIKVRRNAYGTQQDSFSRQVFVDALAKEYETVFIRAPYIVDTNKNVETLLKIDGNIVAARQNNMLATSFHPELSRDSSFHEYFVSFIK
jgi:5'-phosphate synthase pdxT subunit